MERREDLRRKAPRTLGIVLAGGRARRMGGGDKGLLTLAGRSLLDRVVDRLADQLSEGRAAIALNANGDPTRFSHLGLLVVADGLPGFPGPLAGVLAGLDHAAAIGADQVVTVAADTPFYPRDLVARLSEAASASASALAVAATHEPGAAPRIHPTFALWPVAQRLDLRAALVEQGERRVSAYQQAQGAAIATFALAAGPEGAPVDPFFNVNTPDELSEAERLAASPL